MADKSVIPITAYSPTQYNRILNTLKASETRFRRLFETAQDGILILDAQTGKINEVNPFLMDMLGYSRDEILGKKLWEIAPFKDIKAIKAEFSKLQKEQYVRYEDLPLQARDGHTIEVEFVSNVYTVDGTKVIQCNIRNITDRKIAENDLKKATDQKLKDEALNRTERDSFINAVNLLLKMIGKPASHQEYADALVEMLEDWSGCACLGVRITNNGTRQYDSYKGFRQDYWVAQTKVPIEGFKKVKKSPTLVIIPVFYNKKTIALIYLADKRTEEEAPLKIRLIGQLTPLIGESIYKFNMEDKMRTAEQELVQAKRLSDIGILSATVAHELRNPLAAINLAVHNIRRKKQGPLIDAHLDNIDKKIFESDHIISNLLFYARLKTPHYEPINIGSMLNECIELVKKRFVAQNVKVVKKLGPVANIRIQADPFQMKELFINILNNAFDAVPQKGGRISVEARSIAGGSVEVKFHDNGAGVKPEDISKLFEPFFTTKAKGTGLGLAVSHQIVLLHNGSIAVQSPKDKGTTFTVILPRSRSL